MSAPDALQNLPAELVHIIIEGISLNDVKNLRLVCRQLASKVVGRRFLGALERQTTDLTPESLESLEAISRHNALGRMVRHVRVMAEAPTFEAAEDLLAVKRHHLSHHSRNNPSRGDEADPAQGYLKRVNQAEGDLQWLRARQVNADAMPDAVVVDRLARILSCNGQGSLHTLELTARFVEWPGHFTEPHDSLSLDGDRQALWLRASWAYRLTMTALARSGVAFPNLYIYSRITGCSVPSYDINVGLPGLIDAGLGTASASVETLELSFSTRVDHGWHGWERAYGTEVGRQERATLRRQWTVLFDVEAQTHPYDDSMVPEQGEETGMHDDVDYDESDEDLDADIEDREGSEIRGHYRSDYPQALSLANFPGITGLLLHMPNLQVLDLHMYQTLEYEARPSPLRLHHQHRIFGALVRHRVSLPRLRRLSLRGLIFTRQDLLSFLGSHPSIDDLALCNVILSRVRDPGVTYNTMANGVVPECTWEGVLNKALAELSSAKARAGHPRLSKLHLSVLLYQLRPQIQLSSGFPLVNLQPRGELPRRDWLDKGWGSPCRCGATGTFWTCEFSGDELAGPTPLGFVGRGTDICACWDGMRVVEPAESAAAAAYSEIYGVP